jgi:photosystem II stability/assembly factor-like uncharacterized protein
MQRLILVAAIACAGCSEPRWSTALSALDRVPLSVSGVGPTEVYAAGGPLGSTGNALLLRYDGIAWRTISVATTATLWWVFARAHGDVWAAGELGTIVHSDGKMATIVADSPATTATLFGIWGTGPDDLWAVGGHPDADGIVLRKDANGWRTVAEAPTQNGAYFKVWGSASDDVFICGQGGTILHWDGSKLSSQPSGVGPEVSLLTVAGRARDDVYVVGGTGRGVALHYDGTSWRPVSDPALDDAGALAGVAVDVDGRIVIVGAGGVKLRGRPGALVDDGAEPPHDDLHGVWIFRGEIFAVGGNYVAPAPAKRQGVIGHYGDPISSRVTAASP